MTKGWAESPGFLKKKWWCLHVVFNVFFFFFFFLNILFPMFFFFFLNILFPCFLFVCFGFQVFFYQTTWCFCFLLSPAEPGGEALFR